MSKVDELIEAFNNHKHCGSCGAMVNSNQLICDECKETALWRR